MLEVAVVFRILGCLAFGRCSWDLVVILILRYCLLGCGPLICLFVG